MEWQIFLYLSWVIKPLFSAPINLIWIAWPEGEMGLVKTIPDGMHPGSDIANLSTMGFDPIRYYTGRSPGGCKHGNTA